MPNMILECFEYNQHFVAMMNIINHAKLFNKEGKFEKHHIIPRCFYKKKGLEVDNTESNLVNLTIEEHRKVHQLAYLCAKEIVTSSLEYAKRLMNRESLSGMTLDSEWRTNISIAIRKRFEDPNARAKCANPRYGKDNPMYGKRPHNYGQKMDEAQKIKISKTKKELGQSKGKNNPMYGKNAWAIACSRKTAEQIEAIRKSKSEKMKEYHRQRREGGTK